MRTRTVDCRGMRCPQPIIESAKMVRVLENEESFTLLSDDPATHNDLIAWSRMTGHRVQMIAPHEFTVTAVKVSKLS